MTVHVFYPGPDRETYHPTLGKLVRDKRFALPETEAALYIKAGLLKKAETKKTGRAAGKE